MAATDNADLGGREASLESTRILHVITRSEWGGAPRVVQLLATGTEADAAVACGTGGPLIGALREDGIEVFEQPHLRRSPGPIADARAFAALYWLLRRESFDLVHCHSTKAGVLGRLAAAAAGVPSVFTVHGWGFYNTEYGWLAPAIARGERAIAGITEAVVCVSENDHRRGRERNILRRADGHVIHNGIPPLSFPADRASLGDELAIDPETVVVGAIARLAHQKNPLATLRTGRRLQERGHDTTVVLIGDGPLREECAAYIERHGFDAHLLGFHEHALELLVDIDVFLLPSRFEGFPLTVLECLHAGVPVVAHDVGGVAEAVADGETGFVVPAGDEDAFVDRTERLVRDPERRERMGRRARDVARSTYTAERMVERYEAVYTAVLARTDEK